ncbi:prephenate dehydratase [Oceaniserpentilla sp. 4NH20-0058]|uniref:prephenate dehydratase domain-containing protein n=1 Tax=Oceaniserpentilla sp. 4NH20-0058 TaxID=3127660 RepID=UPI00310ACB19
MNKMAFQGQLGAYSHLACTKVNPQAEVVPYDTFAQAIQAVEQDQAKWAMIPLENSSAGRVEEIYRHLPKTHLNIVAEHFQPVSHCWMALPTAKPTWIASHPQALAQCHDRIQGLQLESKVEFDTAGAAKLLAQSQDLTGSVIASELAAKLYGLNILESSFEDISGNTTRFIVLEKSNKVPEAQENKTYITSVIFTVKNIPAALYKALGGFATNGLNLLKIESYLDNQTLHSSRFHIDIAEHIETQAMKRAIDELKFYASEYRWLGTYEAHDFRQKSA